MSVWTHYLPRKRAGCPGLEGHSGAIHANSSSNVWWGGSSLVTSTTHYARQWTGSAWVTRDYSAFNAYSGGSDAAYLDAEGTSAVWWAASATSGYFNGSSWTEYNNSLSGGTGAALGLVPYATNDLYLIETPASVALGNLAYQHWNGSAWSSPYTLIPLTSGVNYQGGRVHGISGPLIYAAGSRILSGSTSAYLAEVLGGSVGEKAVLASPNRFDDVRVFTSSDVRVLGVTDPSTSVAPYSTLWQWNGATLSTLTGPVGTGTATRSRLTRLGGSGASDYWVVGWMFTTGDADITGIACYYNGSAWTIYQPDGAATGVLLEAIHATSSTDVWVAGQKYCPLDGNQRVYIAHYDGSAWTDRSPAS